ncbi:MAG: glycosyltransferase family 39 protein [Gaiellaceae bacterium]
MGRVPAWAWLAGIVVGSIALRAWLGSRMPAPFIFTDELQYQENARSLAAGEGIEVRGEPYGIVSVLYPLLLAPAYLLFDSLPDAYAAARAINSVVMSLAAIPAFLLARRVLPTGLSLVAALLAVALPSLAYTGTLMSENAFYPAFLLAAWALMRALETPSPARQAVLLAACGVAVLVRVQALAIVLAALTAPLLLRAVTRRPLRPFLPLYLVVAGGAGLVLATQLVRGASLNDLFGAYAVVGEGGYDVGEVLKFLFWHVAELDLYVGVFPVAAFVLLAARARSLDAGAQEFVVATIALAAWTLLVVAAFASRFAGAIEERNMFVLAPLLLIALLVWIDRGAPRPTVPAVVAALVTGALPALIPYERFLQLKVRSDTLMIVPLWNVQDSVTLPRLDDVVLVAGVAAGALFLLVPRRYTLVLPALVLGYFTLAIQPIHAGPHGMERAAADALFEGIRVPQRDWIDRSVPDGARVAVLWTGRTHRFTVHQNELFSRSVGPVYTLSGPMPGGFPETAVTVDERTGEVRRKDRAVATAEYALTDGSVALAGEPLARDERLGLTLYRTDGPLISTTSVTGVYNDQWSGAEVSYRRVRCAGGLVRVTIDSDPGLFDEPQVIEATSAGRRVAIQLDPSESARLAAPLVPQNGVCTVRFTISPTAVPGGGDTRELGVHFRAFEYSSP